MYKNWIAVWHPWVCFIISWVSFDSCFCSSCPSFMSSRKFNLKTPQLLLFWVCYIISCVSFNGCSCTTCPLLCLQGNFKWGFLSCLTSSNILMIPIIHRGAWTCHCTCPWDHARHVPSSNSFTRFCPTTYSSCNEPSSLHDKS